MYKPDTVTLFKHYHNVQNKCTTSINESISLFKIKPSKALFVKVDTMLTHSPNKNSARVDASIQQTTHKAVHLFLEDAVLGSVTLLVSI